MNVFPRVNAHLSIPPDQEEFSVQHEADKSKKREFPFVDNRGSKRICLSPLGTSSSTQHLTQTIAQTGFLPPVPHQISEINKEKEHVYLTANKLAKRIGVSRTWVFRRMHLEEVCVPKLDGRYLIPNTAETIEKWQALKARNFGAAPLGSKAQSQITRINKENAYLTVSELPGTSSSTQHFPQAIAQSELLSSVPHQIGTPSSTQRLAQTMAQNEFLSSVHHQIETPPSRQVLTQMIAQNEFLPPGHHQIGTPSSTQQLPQTIAQNGFLSPGHRQISGISQQNVYLSARELAKRIEVSHSWVTRRINLEEFRKDNRRYLIPDTPETIEKWKALKAREF